MLDLLGRRFNQRARSEQAFKSFGALAHRYPESSLADDALLRQGDLADRALNDKQRARAAYRQLQVSFPNSDMAAVAEARLAALEGRPRSAPRQSAAPKPRNPPAILIRGRAPVIVIDPGHGGEDFGAVGVGGLLEKDVVLDLAFHLERLLIERLGAVVRLTRRSDEFVPLAGRTRMANDFEADLFISIHGNASPKKQLRGFEVYYLDTTDDSASRKLAERENASLEFEGAAADLAFMLSDLIQTGKTDQSLQLAHQINVSVMDFVARRWPGVKSLGVKRAPFFVLVGAHMPCVLVEVGFIDQVDDGRILATPEFRNDMADALFVGIRSFLER
jgi:N-acetylmuramoyl-L-alanine amidase